MTRNVAKPVQLVAASTGLQAVTGDERICPAKAMLLGLCRTVPQEYPHVACRSVDVERPDEDGRDADDVAAVLVAEFADDELRPTVAYRNGQRWLQEFEPLQIDETPPAFSPLRWRGVYMITGGLGRIGLELAGELARLAHARLVLVGRSASPRSRGLGRVAREPRGGRPAERHHSAPPRPRGRGRRAALLQADVADLAQVRAAVDATYARFGRLDGLIHGAGNVTPEGFFSLDEADPDRCERQFEAKIRGVITLERVLRHEPLDMVVLMSSISSVLAGLGYVAYGAGNAFMDAFAHKHNGSGGVPWISIDWDTWESASEDDADVDPVRLSMNPEEGVEAFRRIVSGLENPQVVVSTGYLPDRIRQWIDLRSLREGMVMREREAERFHERPELGTVHVAPRTALEESIVEVWEEVLGLRPVGVVDNFFDDLGGDSLLAAQLVSRLRSRFEMEIPLRRFFDGPRVVELAEVIGAHSERQLLTSGGTP